MWLIGFEFESNFLLKKHQKTNDFIKKFVIDKSCAIEAISHPVELTDNSGKRENIFNIFKQNKNIILSEQNEACGGHITISKKGLSGLQIFNKAKNYMGFFYSLFRGRLSAWACHSNIYIEEEKNNKFGTIRFKKDVLEIRLFPHYMKMEDIFLRYKLVFELCKAIDLNLSYDEFIDNCKFTYNKKSELFDQIVKESYYFQEMINNKKYSKFTLKYMKRFKRFYEIQRLRNENKR
tara:strand:+ start:1091 stop:1795 length:705 start_codon:yes stop_codon:yes gene_type:complete